MKKITIILVCLALASCTKDVKIPSGGDVPVGFTPMTGNIATKAPVYYGEQNSTYTGKGSQYEKFKAYAVYTAASGTNPKTGGTEFFSNVECVHEGSKPNDYWKTDPTYYWPKNGYLSFHAISPSDLTPSSSTKGTVSHDWEKGFTIENFQSFTGTNHRNMQVDILYSDFELKKKRSDYNPETGTPYDEASEAAGYSHKGVNLTFHHALAAVNFYFKTDAVAVGNVTYTFKTTKLELLNVNYKGEFHENRTSAANNNYADVPAAVAANAITFNDDNATTATPYWIPVANQNSTFLLSQMTSDPLNATPRSVGSMMLLMPQNLTHGGKTVQARITYYFSYKVGSEAAHEYGDLQVTIPLAGLPGTIGGTPTTVNQWLINHKYTYTITFHLDPLLFDPRIDVDYVDVSPVGVELPYQESTP